MKRLRQEVFRKVGTIVLCLALAFANAQSLPDGFVPSIGGNNPLGEMFGGSGGGGGIEEWLSYFEDAGTIIGAIGGVIDLFENFSVEKLCGTAGAVNGVVGDADSAAAIGYFCAIAQALSGFLSGDMTLSDLFASACEAATNVDAVDEGQDNNPEDGDLENAKKAACKVSQIAEQINKLLEDTHLTVEDIANSPLAEDIIYSLGGSPEQVKAYAQRIDGIINGNKSASEIAQESIELAKDIVEDEWKNRDSAEGTADMAREYFGVVEPYLEARDLQKFARLLSARFQLAANTQGSGETLKTQDPELATAITETVENVAAPKHRAEAATAVSTRATVQEVVNVMTAYMEQDATQFARLSQQLTGLAMQMVYTTHSLQLAADAIIAQESEEDREKQANLEAAANNGITRITDVGKLVEVVLASYTQYDGEYEAIVASNYAVGADGP